MAELSFLQIAVLVLVAMLVGAGLLMLLIGWLSAALGDESGSGCLAIGLTLLGIAAYAALRTFVA
jgi:apolipoprotein N-acyltransferase